MTNQVDNPFIMIAQAVIAASLFRLFYALRRAKQPLPQLIGLFAFGELANLAARSAKSDWFATTDIIQYGLFAGAAVFAVLAALKQNKTEAARPEAAVIVPDFFDKIETKAVWLFSLLVGLIVLYNYTNMYFEFQKSKTETLVKVEQAKVQTQAEQNELLCETKQTQANLLAAVTSISATQGTIIANQAKNIAAQIKASEDLKKQIKQQPKESKKAPEATGKTDKPATEPEQKPDTEKPGFWKRFFGGKSARVDSVGVKMDTLVFQHQ